MLSNAPVVLPPPPSPRKYVLIIERSLFARSPMTTYSGEMYNSFVLITLLMSNSSHGGQKHPHNGLNTSQQALQIPGSYLVVRCSTNGECPLAADVLCEPKICHLKVSVGI